MSARVALLLPFLWSSVASAADPPSSSCIACHGDSTVFDAGARAKVEQFHGDVHAEVGLSCHDCHGGNPDPFVAEDMDAAMDSGFPPNPYRGVPARADIPAFCGRCHSDPVLMRRYRPELRVDQEAEYRTSYHGLALARGDTRVATCIDCHGVHEMLRPTNSRSPVHATRVAETCKSCHADPARMAGSMLPDGRPLPVDQYDRWRRSVHAVALLEKGDLSSPTCNDCHGNHGAVPPGLESVAYVCGQCHGREADLFRASPKRQGFEEHNRLLVEEGDGACGTCHGASEPPATLSEFRRFSECITCHENHAIQRPTMALLGNLPPTPCAFCHEGPEPATEDEEEPTRIRRHYILVRDALLVQAGELGLSDEARFDWLVDRALDLSTHTVRSEEEGAKPELRPQFARLFQKFRIGKTSYAYFDPAPGREIMARVMQCGRCHASQPELAETPVGIQTAGDLLHRMQELTTMTARAERVLLAAQRGGVEVREGLSLLDKAVDSQIELEVLVHTFSAGEGSPFLNKHAEGMSSAQAALLVGREGLREIRQRRLGLAVSLALVLFTLAGLSLKIRRLPT